MPPSRRKSGDTVAAVIPLTADRWPDVEALFGASGACYGCWCQYWRMPRAEWRKSKAAANRTALRAQAGSGRPPGLIGYDAAGQPVGWVSLGPRDDFPGLRSGRFFGETPDTPGVWSIVCFYVPAKHRRRHVAEGLLQGAVADARRAGARILEAYPWDLSVKTAAASSLYVGTLPLFRRAGFAVASRLVPHRPVVRLALRGRGQMSTIG